MWILYLQFPRKHALTPVNMKARDFMTFLVCMSLSLYEERPCAQMTFALAIASRKKQALCQNLSNLQK